MKLFRVTQKEPVVTLEATGETFKSQADFISYATNPNQGDTYSGDWKLIGRTESDIITLVPVTVCKVLVK
jgi:hypothetical protein